MLALADAVAARFAAVPTPSGETVGLKGATARTPNNLPGTPFVIVELPSSDEVLIESGRRLVTHDFEVIFLLERSSGDIPTDKVRLLRWLPGLLDATFAALKLGRTDVRKSYVTEYEYGTYAYGGTEYHAWRLTCRVWTEDAITLVAA